MSITIESTGPELSPPPEGMSISIESDIAGQVAVIATGGKAYYQRTSLGIIPPFSPTDPESLGWKILNPGRSPDENNKV